MKRSTLVLACAAAAATAAGCSEDGGTNEPAGVFQLAGVVANPAAVSCGTQAVATWQSTFRIHLVNTTGTDVTVTKVSSHGLITAGTREEEFGQPALVFANLAFTPPSAVVVARTGDLTIEVPMNVQCGTHPAPGTEIYRDMLMTLSVTTSAGQFNATPIVFRLTYRPL